MRDSSARALAILKWNSSMQNACHTEIGSKQQLRHREKRNKNKKNKE